MLDKEITTREVVEGLQLLDTSKTVGPDGIDQAITNPLVDILGEILARQGQITKGLASIGRYSGAQGGRQGYMWKLPIYQSDLGGAQIV